MPWIWRTISLPYLCLYSGSPLLASPVSSLKLNSVLEFRLEGRSHWQGLHLRLWTSYNQGLGCSFSGLRQNWLLFYHFEEQCRHVCKSFFSVLNSARLQLTLELVTRSPATPGTPRYELQEAIKTSTYASYVVHMLFQSFKKWAQPR